MPTNEERREVAEKLRNLAGTYVTLGDLQEALGIDLTSPDVDIERDAENLNRLSDLIEPDYTSEENGYFILPKPREPLVIRDNPINGSVYEIVNENVREWQKQIEEDIQQRLFETFRKTCYDTDHMGDAIECSECGDVTRETLYWVDVGEDARTVKGRMPLFCAHCGAKVVQE